MTVAPGAPLRGVVLDWRGTLVRTLTDDEWLAAALRELGRTLPPDEHGRLVGVLGSLAGALDAPGTDTSATRHRSTYLAAFRGAGLDDGLAAALYAVESDPAHNPFAEDAVPTVRALADAGIRVAVLSDVHVDIRPSFTAAGLAGCVDCFSLSYETGLQKPDPRVFRRTLEALGTRAGETLMVGDRAGPDGGAVAVGMPTLLLPPLADVRERRLWPLLRLFALESSD